MEDNDRLKMAVIAGASNALRYKEQKPHETDEEIIRRITADAEKIVENID